MLVSPTKERQNESDLEGADRTERCSTVAWQRCVGEHRGGLALPKQGRVGITQRQIGPNADTRDGRHAEEDKTVLPAGPGWKLLAGLIVKISDVSGDALPRTDDASVIRFMSKVLTESCREQATLCGD